jgi:hypothetical protein
MTEGKLDKILAAVIHVKDKVDNEMATKDEIAALQDKLLTHVDGFVKLHETLDQELVSLRHKYDRLEGRMKKVEEKVGINPEQ